MYLTAIEKNLNILLYISHNNSYLKQAIIFTKEHRRMEQLLLSKQPQYLEFSYETMCHTKVTPKEYEVCIAIPQSKKYIGYITMIQEPPHANTYAQQYPNTHTPHANTYTHPCANTHTHTPDANIYANPCANTQGTTPTNTNPAYPILIIYELNRFRKVNGIYAVSTVDVEMCEVASWMEETIFYGSIVDSFFIMEDILYYKNTSMRNAVFKEKMEKMTYILSLSDFFDWIPPSHHPSHCPPPSPDHHEFTGKMKLVFPMFFQNVEQTTIDINMVPYPIHHVQYKSINLLKPILNVSLARNGTLVFKTQPVVKETNQQIGNTGIAGNNTTASYKKNGCSSSPHSYRNKFGTAFTFSYGKPQYKKLTMFEVMADVQYDVYLLYAYNNLAITTQNRSASASSKPFDKHIYVNVAFISTYATSKMMNGIFRKIKENVNLDYIEESDDEDDFENSDPEKYVDLKKKVIMECQFNFKFKKWMPLRVVENSNGYNKIVPISNL